MQKDLSPSGFAVTTRPSELCEVGIHMCVRCMEMLQQIRGQRGSTSQRQREI